MFSPRGVQTPLSSTFSPYQVSCESAAPFFGSGRTHRAAGAVAAHPARATRARDGGHRERRREGRLEPEELARERLDEAAAAGEEDDGEGRAERGERAEAPQDQTLSEHLCA